ncbi:MAG TPA: TetR/AcrR family transcriptional regulator [Gemmataceae bacterium]|jgi:AcrR family transcriptional regulator|nr:TetR/AcrR family transcriptional regulator [Gemmataceae bacterium]
MKSATLKKPRRPADEELWERRREEILDAAAVMFARHGYAGTDTQLLVDKLRVGKGTLYRYFRSKEELFLATVDRAMHIARRAVDDGIQNIEDPLDRIAQAIRIYLGFFAEHPDYVELFMQERAQFKDRKTPTYFQHRNANVERWRAVYRSLIAEGRIRQMPVERITDVMGDLVYGTMFTNYFTGRQKPLDEQAQDILDIVFHGVFTEAERKRRPPKTT